MKNKSMQIVMILVLMFAVVTILMDGEQVLTSRIVVKPTRYYQIVPTLENSGYPAPIQPTETLSAYPAPWTKRPTPTQLPTQPRAVDATLFYHLPPTSTPWPTAIPNYTPTANPDI